MLGITGINEDSVSTEEFDVLGSLVEKANENGLAIDSDLYADWAAGAIGKERAVADRKLALCDAEIEAIKTTKLCIEDDYKRKTAWLRDQLAQYMRLHDADCQETKTQKKYSLLKADLIIKKPALKLEKVSDDELIKYLTNNGQVDYLQKTVKPMWGEYKKTLSVVDGKVVTEDGEIIPESVVKAEESAPEFSIKIK